MGAQHPEVAVISPHGDDAVLGCSGVLAAHPGSVVVTVFSGEPPRLDALNPWETGWGVPPPQAEAPARRRAEDRAAHAVLGARSVWLDFWDARYGRPCPVQDVADALGRAIDAVGAAVVVLPLGLFHPDHVLAHHAALMARRERRGLAWLAYEDALYRRLPGCLEQRRAALRGAGIALRPDGNGHPPAAPNKLTAVGCYRPEVLARQAPPQLGLGDLGEPEVTWRLDDGP